MHWLPFVFALIVAVEHVYILILEMFRGTSKTTQRTFKLEERYLSDYRTKALLANQGLYNGFLAVGILWGLFFVPGTFQFQVVVYFVSCVIVAALYGTISTRNSGILLKQGLPAILAMIFLIIF